MHAGDDNVSKTPLTFAFSTGFLLWFLRMMRTTNQIRRSSRIRNRTLPPSSPNQNVSTQIPFTPKLKYEIVQKRRWCSFLVKTQTQSADSRWIGGTKAKKNQNQNGTNIDHCFVAQSGYVVGIWHAHRRSAILDLVAAKKLFSGCNRHRKYIPLYGPLKTLNPFLNIKT